MFGFSTAIARFPYSGHLIVLLNNAGGVPLDNMTDEIAWILDSDH